MFTPYVIIIVHPLVETGINEYTTKLVY